MGALVGTAVVNPVAAFSLGFISHFFADMVPHGDEHMYEGYKSGNKVTRALIYVGLDALATVALIAVFFLGQDFFSPMAVAMGILGGLLPDLMVGLVELIKPKQRTWLNRKLAWFHGFHMANHHFIIKHVRKERDIPFHYGLALQGIVLSSLVKIIM